MGHEALVPLVALTVALLILFAIVGIFTLIEFLRLLACALVTLALLAFLG